MYYVFAKHNTVDIEHLHEIVFSFTTWMVLADEAPAAGVVFLDLAQIELPCFVSSRGLDIWFARANSGSRVVFQLGLVPEGAAVAACWPLLCPNNSLL